MTLWLAFIHALFFWGQGLPMPTVGNQVHGGGGGITLINASAVVNGVNGATTTAQNMTDANFCAAAVADFTGGPAITVSSSPSNTWQFLPSHVNTPGNAEVSIYYATNATVNGTMTFTVSGSGIFAAIGGACWSGVKTSSPYNSDETGVNDFNTATGANLQPGAITFAAGNLGLSAVVTPFGFTYTWTVDTATSGYNILAQFSDGTTEGIAWGYVIDSGGTSRNPAWNAGTTYQSAGLQATFAHQ